MLSGDAKALRELFESFGTPQEPSKEDPFASFRAGFQKRPGVSVFGRAGLRLAVALGRSLADSVRDAVEEYDDPRVFEKDWKYARLVVPLQIRLLIEQILWDKRGGWRDLVTGFNPVKRRIRR